MHAPPDLDRTDTLPRTDGGPGEMPAVLPLPYRGASPRLAAAWFWLCVWATLGLWTWALVLAGRALYGAG